MTRLLLLGILFILSPLSLNAEVTREQAIDILHRVLSPTTLKREAVAYLTLEPLKVGDTVVPFAEEARAFTVTNRAWFGYIDDDPSAFFAHSVRFVYIDLETGAAKVVVQEWWPEINGAALFSRDAVKAKPELRIFSTRDTK
ncbi:MAG: hypothetical protein ACKV19_12255 [Verrucomicrobiales bacterium]